MVKKSLQVKKRVQRRTPGGRLVTKFRRSMYGKAQCGICGSYLKGVIRASPHKVKSASKSDRRPNRPFGGVLCNKCTVKIISLKSKLKMGFAKKEDVPISLRKYVV